MSDIIVNKVALASDLAEAEVKSWFDFDEEIYIQDPDSTVGGTIYTDEAQGIYDMYYDRYMKVIERNEFPGQIRRYF